MKAQHTPGPWKATGDYGYANGIPFEGVVAIGGPTEGDRGICYVIGDPEDEMAKANARLIAAAPDLLSELQHIVSLLDPVLEAGLPVPGIATLNRAKEIIRKATNPL